MKNIKTTAVAILTFRRLGALQTMLEGLARHCPHYQIGIFEDCGNRDGTSAFLSKGEQGIDRDDLLATEYKFAPNISAFLGKVNLGVSGNSNRAIKWFMDGNADHLCLCNDDLHVLGDFPALYREAHKDLGVGFFCFNDFWEMPTHRWMTARCRGYRLRVFGQMTAIMTSTLRHCVNEVGYFDTRFGKFGQEHCDWNNRMRMAKFIQLDGLDQPCIDVEPSTKEGNLAPALLRHQDVPTSLTGPERLEADAEANVRIQEAAARYMTEHYYRPFSLIQRTHAGGTASSGIKTEDMPKYKTLVSS